MVDLSTVVGDAEPDLELHDHRTEPVLGEANRSGCSGFREPVE